MDTMPRFLRRSKASRVADDIVQRGLAAARLLGGIAASMTLKNLQIVTSSCALLFDPVQVRLCFSSSLLLERRLTVPLPLGMESPPQSPFLAVPRFRPAPASSRCRPRFLRCWPRLPTFPILHAMRLLLPAIRPFFSGSPRLPPGARLPVSRY
ncbi:hypothetical protein FB451DRAFT_1226750 [Mycena latifolia]|nr:hypothetical protein FB451DRAFT_1226750 [Mycena latifolia]